MDLYLNLKKAEAGGSHAGQNTNVSAPRRKRMTEESYNKHPIGVMGGDGKADNPNVGPKHNHSTTVDEELEDERQEYSNKQDSKNIIRAPKEKDDVKKSLMFLDCIGDLVKGNPAHNPTEVEFLVQEMGYTQEDINKGITLDGDERSRFGQWLSSRTLDSVHQLIGE